MKNVRFTNLATQSIQHELMKNKDFDTIRLSQPARKHVRLIFIVFLLHFANQHYLNNECTLVGREKLPFAVFFLFFFVCSRGDITISCRTGRHWASHNLATPLTGTGHHINLTTPLIDILSECHLLHATGQEVERGRAGACSATGYTWHWNKETFNALPYIFHGIRLSKTLFSKQGFQIRSGDLQCIIATPKTLFQIFSVLISRGITDCLQQKSGLGEGAQKRSKNFFFTAYSLLTHYL